MSIFKRKSAGEDRQGESRKTGASRMLFMGQSVWYMLTILIFLGCTLMGFGVAYFIVKVLIDLNVK